LGGIASIFNVLEGDPDIGAGGVAFETGSNPRVGVDHGGKPLAVQRPGQGGRGGIGDVGGIVAFGKRLFSGFFGVQGGQIQHRAEFGFAA